MLDDSANAVDAAMNARIGEVLGAVIPGTTRTVITQRISSVQHTDHILVVKDGRINGRGTNNRLVKSNKIYREICESRNRDGEGFDQV